MEGKIGAAVAIEPATGEILMMVSSPTYDPDELVGANAATTTCRCWATSAVRSSTGP